MARSSILDPFCRPSRFFPGLARSTAAVCILAPGMVWASTWQFTEISDQIGVTFEYQIEHPHFDTRDAMTGGLAAADINGNGLIDLYIPQGNLANGLLLENQGDGTFSEVSETWGLTVGQGPNIASYATGAAFADLTGNGFPDLVLPGVRGFGLRLYLNNGSEFIEATRDWGLFLELQEQFSVTFADVNGNGRLDLAAAHWNEFEGGQGGYLWLNQGDQLVDVSDDWGLTPVFAEEDFTFTPNFADLNGNGWPDLMIAADFGTSQYFLNQDGEGYLLATTEVISDENGMGAAVADFNNNGHPDWFVTSIYHELPEFPVGNSGNRLYVNDGHGQFADLTETAGVRDGDWGWGACAADFNLNGHLDLFMVNGWSQVNPNFSSAAARLYVNQGDGSFIEQAVELGAGDTGEGRGVVCFDFDRDGDIDIFIQNNRGPGRVYRNNASELGRNWLGIRLRGDAPNTAGVGAVITVKAGDLEQVRQMQIPNHYLSTSPPELLFGLDTEETIDQVRVAWPDGQIDEYNAMPINQWVDLHQSPDDQIFYSRFQTIAP